MEVLSFSDRRETHGCVLALGFFDGVHLGHRELLKRAGQLAEAHDALAVGAFTFKNTLFTKEAAEEGLIYPYAERLGLFKEAGADLVLSTEFSESFSTLSPEEFLNRLFSALPVAGVVVGPDYTFGAGRSGTVRTLQKAAMLSGRLFSVVEKVCFAGAPVSSTRIKAALREGDMSLAGALLGKPYRIFGDVARGRGIGRLYRFPTANQEIPADKFLPKPGVYGSFAAVEGIRYRAVTNIGARPTFDLQGTTIETHLIGFEGDLYGKALCVELCRYLRGTERFESPSALAAQIERDKKWTE